MVSQTPESDSRFGCVSADAEAGLTHREVLRPRVLVLDQAGVQLAEVALDVPLDAGFGELFPYEWSDHGRYLYVTGEAGFLVIDAGSRAVAARVPPDVAEGCDLALHPTLPLAFVTDCFGLLSVLDLSGFPPR